MPPARKVAIVTCMDARIHPEQALGLEIGDAHMIRNAGGRVSDDALRSLVISSRLLGTNEFAVIHHTDCGMLTFTNDDLHTKLHERDRHRRLAHRLPAVPGPRAERARRRLRDPRVAVHRRLDPVSGYIYDVQTGAVTQVVAPTTAIVSAG